VEPSAELNVLLARLADGDRAVFTEVFRLLWPPIHRLCRAYTQNPADAEDAAQQAMEKIFIRASDYDPTRPALPWALAIAGWECRTLLRKRLRRREVPGPPTGPSDPTAMQEHDLMQRELLESARAAMQELSELDQETLVATFWEVAGVARGATLRKRRERALERLRLAFGRLYGLD
jgi:RNA polymerase sigma-70 factor (ECF subfamily)